MKSNTVKAAALGVALAAASLLTVQTSAAQQGDGDIGYPAPWPVDPTATLPPVPPAVWPTCEAGGPCPTNTPITFGPLPTATIEPGGVGDVTPILGEGVWFGPRVWLPLLARGAR